MSGQPSSGRDKKNMNIKNQKPIKYNIKNTAENLKENRADKFEFHDNIYKK